MCNALVGLNFDRANWQFIRCAEINFRQVGDMGGGIPYITMSVES
jgi:hypothetical protein